MKENKVLLTGNEAIARGVYEAGVVFAAAYPGTPSTEILENLNAFSDVMHSEWSTNEKVSLETAVGAAMAGARSFVALKNVGLNVAADPFMLCSYTGVNAGLVLVSADDPGQHASSNEQDNRYYAKFAKVPMLEPSDSDEAKKMTIYAFDLSEEFRVPVMIRETTRVCHSKSITTLGERKEVPMKEYVKDPSKTNVAPKYSKTMRLNIETRLVELEKVSNESIFNVETFNTNDIGIIANGVGYQYAVETFGNEASYLKIGMTHPLPMKKIKEFAAKVKTLYIVEEGEPFMEDQIRMNGIECIGKEMIPLAGELNPFIIGKSLKNEDMMLINVDKNKTPARPPVLCAGCPHRGFFYELSKLKDVVVTSDIGCYGLGGEKPLDAIDSVLCMGAAFGMGHGAQIAFDRGNVKKRTIGVLGDSTFFHTGLNGLINVIYNNSKTISVILDNRITGMTGHQENPCSGYSLMGDKTNIVDIGEMCSAMGFKHVFTINPNDLDEVRETLENCLSIDEPSVIITRWPCMLKKLTQEDKDEFGDIFGTCKIDQDKCIGCKLCMKVGCPAISSEKIEGKNVVSIDPLQCTGCEVCAQVCPKDAIEREVN